MTETTNDPTSATISKAESTRGIVLFIGSDILGRGDDNSLGVLLLQKFLHVTASLITKPETIILMNNGVKLAAKGSAVLGELQILQSQGIDVLVCGTCLQRFQLMDKVKVGQQSDMFTMANIIFRAKKVVTL
jgi:selenium metabolism protein YedF